MKTSIFPLALFLLLSACAPPPQESSETSRRIAACEEAMKLYIAEAKTYDRDRKKIIGSCQISQRERTLEQWQCVVAAQRQGRKYAEASDQCGRTPAANPARPAG